MEIVRDFFILHKNFFIPLFAVLACYYTVLFMVFGKRNKKTDNDKNIDILNKDVKNISILAEELDDYPVVENKLESVDTTVSKENDWKSVLDKINSESERLNHNETLDELLNDSGIDIGE